MARPLTNARNILLPNRGHNDTDPCVSEIITAYVNAGNVNGLDTSCLAKTEDLTFALIPDELMK